MYCVLPVATEQMNFIFLFILLYSDKKLYIWIFIFDEYNIKVNNVSYIHIYIYEKDLWSSCDLYAWFSQHIGLVVFKISVFNQFVIVVCFATLQLIVVSPDGEQEILQYEDHHTVKNNQGRQEVENLGVGGVLSKLDHSTNNTNAREDDIQD